MNKIKLSRESWKESPHTHCILAVYENRSIGEPFSILSKKFPIVTARRFYRAIRRFDSGRPIGKKSLASIDELAIALGYEGVEWVER